MVPPISTSAARLGYCPAAAGPPAANRRVFATGTCRHAAAASAHAHFHHDGHVGLPAFMYAATFSTPAPWTRVSTGCLYQNHVVQAHAVVGPPPRRRPSSQTPQARRGFAGVKYGAFGAGERAMIGCSGGYPLMLDEVQHQPLPNQYALGKSATRGHAGRPSRHRHRQRAIRRSTTSTTPKTNSATSTGDHAVFLGHYEPSCSKPSGNEDPMCNPVPRSSSKAKRITAPLIVKPCSEDRIPLLRANHAIGHR